MDIDYMLCNRICFYGSFQIYNRLCIDHMLCNTAIIHLDTGKNFYDHQAFKPIR